MKSGLIWLKDNSYRFIKVLAGKIYYLKHIGGEWIPLDLEYIKIIWFKEELG